MTASRSEIQIVRAMVTLSVIAYVSWLFGRIMFWNDIDPDLRKILMVDGFGSRLPESEHAYLFWMILSLASYLGIWIRRRWGRNLLLLTYVLACLSAPFSGAMVNAPLERFLMMVWLLSDGGIIALCFLAWPGIFVDIQDKR